MDASDRNLLEELTVESKEHLQEIEPDLLALEGGGEIDSESVNKIFRAVHSIKGGFSFFGFEKIKELSHKTENVLGMIRDGKLAITSEIVDVLLKSMDKIQAMIDDVDSSEEYDIDTELSQLYSLMDPDGKEVPDSGAVPSETGNSGQKEKTADFPEDVLSEAGKLASEGKHLYSLSVSLRDDLLGKGRELKSFLDDISGFADILKIEPDMSDITGLEDSLEKDIIWSIFLSTVLEKALFIPTVDIDEEKVLFKKCTELRGDKDKTKPVNEQKLSDSQKTRKASKSESAETIRVKVDLLNRLINLAGELVLSRNQLLQFFRNTEEAGIKNVLQNIDVVVSELQENIMNTRMQPIGSLFNKYPRVIRDLARRTGKEIELNITGEGVELDKSIIESLTDPLLHIVRNSGDHGIEGPDKREKLNKPRKGTVTLKAFHEGGQVNIQIADDGGGINRDAVLNKAIEKDIIGEDEAEGLSDRDVYDLLFAPGFSTAEKVTEVSGRGVGMDVVKTNIEKLGGSIEVESKEGRGTTMTLRLPLTLAIIPSLIITAEGRKFAIPQVNLIELVRLRAAEAAAKIEKVRGNDVLRLRDKLLPLVKLNDILEISGTFLHPETKERVPDARRNLADRRSVEKNGEDNLQIRRQRTGKDRRQSSKSAINIVVLKMGGNSYGLIVDSLLDSEEIVVKPLSDYLKNSKCYSGSTIMGDGRVAMILDTEGIARKAELKFEELSKESQRQARAYARDLQKESQSFLLFKCSGSEEFTINLAIVSRIEKVTKDRLQVIGEKEYLKYEDHSLRLIRPHKYMPVSAPAEDSDEFFVIIPKLVKEPMGIIAESVSDVVESSAALEKSGITGTGIHGSMVFEGKMVILMDIYSLFETVEPDKYSFRVSGKELQGVRVLLAEDTDFFRSLESGYLKDIGCRVTEVPDGVRAWEELQKNSYDILVTDIEMPEMDGFELTRKIRNSEKFPEMPVIALTAMGGEVNRKTGFESGVDAYEVKLDKDSLLKSMKKILGRVPEKGATENA
ncbi:MAG: chemotaxis protein CheW [Fibrobacterota bacterium]